MRLAAHNSPRLLTPDGQQILPRFSHDAIRLTQDSHHLQTDPQLTAGRSAATVLRLGSPIRLRLAGQRFELFPEIRQYLY